MGKSGVKRTKSRADVPPLQSGRHSLAPLAKTLSEEVYGLLKRDILSGRLVPGSKLQFRHLGERYAFGIAPLREALTKLATERLVMFEGQRGFAVADISRTELHDVCSLWSELSVGALGLSIERGDTNWEADVLSPWRLHFCSVMSAQFERYRRVIPLCMAISTPTARKVDEEHRQIAEAAVAREKVSATNLLAAHFSGSLEFLDAQFGARATDAEIR